MKGAHITDHAARRFREKGLVSGMGVAVRALKDFADDPSVRWSPCLDPEGNPSWVAKLRWHVTTLAVFRVVDSVHPNCDYAITTVAFWHEYQDAAATRSERGPAKLGHLVDADKLRALKARVKR